MSFSVHFIAIVPFVLSFFLVLYLQQHSREDQRKQKRWRRAERGGKSKVSSEKVDVGLCLTVRSGEGQVNLHFVSNFCLSFTVVCFKRDKYQDATFRKGFGMLTA